MNLSYDFCRKMQIALIFGGEGPEHRVSLMGAVHASKILSELKIPTLSVYITPEGGWYLLSSPEQLDAGLDIDKLTPTFPIRLGKRCGFLNAEGDIIRVDAAIPILHGIRGEDGYIQGVLDTAGIPYVGCDVAAGAICADKAYCKLAAEAAGVPTVPWILCAGGAGTGEPLLAYSGRVAYSAQSAVELTELRLGYPVFVKPTDSGSSLGASAAQNREELLAAIDSAAGAGCGRVIIEKLLENKRELEVAYFGHENVFTAPGEVSLSGFYDFDAKYMGTAGVCAHPAASVGDDVRAKLRHYAEIIIRSLSVRDLSRVDFFLCGDEIYFNEINTFPGFTDGSLYLSMLDSEGIGEGRAILGLIMSALKRECGFGRNI